jgi:Zn-dependent protease
MDWRQTIYFIVGLLIGVILHEYMHGRIADMLGDHTARNAGRLTLNPIPHIDPFGTILLPLAMIVVRSPVVFGYAKPVPVNPFFLKKPRRDMLLVALSGPLTNFAIGFGIALVGMIFRLIGVTSGELFLALYYIAQINVILALFNLIPVPPLDGSHILEYFLPTNMKRAYESIAPYGFMILFAFLWIFGRWFFNLMSPVFRLLARMITGV